MAPLKPKVTYVNRQGNKMRKKIHPIRTLHITYVRTLTSFLVPKTRICLWGLWRVIYDYTKQPFPSIAKVNQIDVTSGKINLIFVQKLREMKVSNANKDKESILGRNTLFANWKHFILPTLVILALMNCRLLRKEWQSGASL